MAEKKMTKREGYTKLLALDEVKANKDLVAMVEHELELLDKKNSKGSGKPTANQVANEGIKNEILANMADNHLYTITEMIKGIPALNELTNQKVSSLMRQLVAEHMVTRTKEKNKTYFQKV